MDTNCCPECGTYLNYLGLCSTCEHLCPICGDRAMEVTSALCWQCYDTDDSDNDPDWEGCNL